ncbi:MAG: SPOR domain-containing protein [Tatlockia sp.]|nr:SPOR domain-containing protein [Tatlockia sp.]
MAKDYGTRRPAVRRKNSPKQLFWLLASFLCGYLAATVFDFTSLSSWVNNNILSKQNLVKPQAQVALKQPDLPKPKFEFYTLLAKDRRGAVPAPIAKPQPEPLQIKPQTAQPISVAAKPAPAATSGKSPVVVVGNAVAQGGGTRDSYLIQLAAFKNRQDAEHMKAALTLKGFDVNIVATSPQQGGWFRVIAGPYSSRAVAEKTQISLAQNERIKGMIRRMEG